MLQLSGQPLSQLENQKNKIISITSGKGGVGKTTLSSNMAVQLAKQGHRVLLLDTDFGLANVDLTLGLVPKFNISHFLLGKCSIQETIHSSPLGVDIIPSSSGIQEFSSLDHYKKYGLISALSEVFSHYDYVLLDTAAGISKTTTSFVAASHSVVVVLSDDILSLADAYSMIKVLSTQHQVKNINIVVNMLKGKLTGRSIFNRLKKGVARFISGVSLSYLGEIKYDERVASALCAQVPIVLHSPSSLASQGINNVLDKLEEQPCLENMASGMGFYL